MDKLIERVEDNFISIYKKFDIINEKLNNYHIKFDKINKMLAIIISNEYTKIYKTYYPMKNFDLSQDRFFIYNALIDIPLKKNTFIIFEYIFQAEYIDIPLVLKKYNKIRHMFKFDHNITKINSSLYLYNNEIYNDEKMGYLKKWDT